MFVMFSTKECPRRLSHRLYVHHCRTRSGRCAAKLFEHPLEATAPIAVAPMERYGTLKC